MTQQHPITPPPELAEQWVNEAYTVLNGVAKGQQHVANSAAQWGADQELEACCEVLHQHDRAYLLPSQLRAARRPKPPSLAETAIYELDEAVMRGDCITTTDAMPHLRAALKRLAELENQPQS